MSNKGNISILALVLAIGLVFGWLLHGFLVKSKIKTITLPAKVETKTETVIKYVAKENKKDEDVNIQIPKQEIKVRVNDKVINIKKADNEKYIFDKNKLQLNQQSKIELNLHVPIIRKRWGIGIGSSLNGEPAYIVKFPIRKSPGNLNAWIYHCAKESALGVIVEF